MSAIDYGSIVRETLNQIWSQYHSPLQINIRSEDVRIGVELLTQIALKRAISEIPAAVSSDLEALQPLVSKIQEFIKKHAFTFGEVCISRFPFSLALPAAAQQALQYSLEDLNPIILHFLQETAEGLNEKELDSFFAKIVQQIKSAEITKTCSLLRYAYLKKGDLQAGFLLLWILKQAAGCDYDIPKRASFTKQTVTQVLSQFILDGCTKNPSYFVSIMYRSEGRSSRFLFEDFLSQNLQSSFVNFAFKQLQRISFAQWPHKIHLIIQILGVTHREELKKISYNLMISDDPITSQLGCRLLAAFSCASLTEAIPSLYQLQEEFPAFSNPNIQAVFKFPFPPFLKKEPILEERPDFTRYLSFAGMNPVFAHRSLLIGEYRCRTRFSNHDIPPYLLAYDKITEKLIWGIPLISDWDVPGRYHLKQVGELLALQFEEDSAVRFLQPDTGKTQFVLECPEIFTDCFDQFYCHPTGIVYQVADPVPNRRFLLGGYIVNQKWQRSFQIEISNEEVYPLATHCAVEDETSDGWIIFGPTGDRATIPYCVDAKAKNDTLYCIEKNPNELNTCLFTVRTLKSSAEVFSPVEKAIVLQVKSASIDYLGPNGQCILAARGFIFLDLKTDHVTYSDYLLSLQHKKLVSEYSGEVWAWDTASQELYKISPAGHEFMGLLKTGTGTDLVHVDEENRLYFTTIR